MLCWGHRDVSVGKGTFTQAEEVQLSSYEAGQKEVKLQVVL